MNILLPLKAVGAGAVVVAVIAVVIGIALIPTVVSSTHDANSDPYQEVFNNVTTGAGETSKVLALAKAHFHSDCTHITVTSSLNTDTPTCSAYNSSTKQVTVGGLTASATRNLTVNYEVDALEGYGGASAIMRLIPLVFVGGLIIITIMYLLRK